MKTFTVVRFKKNGRRSVHTVYVKSIRKARELVWPDDHKEIGRLVY